MHIVVVGVNHRSAPIELREQLAFRREHLPEAFARLRRDLALPEAAILSTCNRVEIYAAAPRVDRAVERLQRFLSEHGRVSVDGLAPQLYSYTEPRSIHHLFSVASGLDSMVLGEAEILGQVKRAYEQAREFGATGKAFNVLFQKALHAAKTVRAQTAVGRGGTSIGSVAVELAGKIFGRLAGSSVLLVGAGKIGEVTLQRLMERGATQVRVMNRTPERAAQVAAAYHAQACAWEGLPAQLAVADIVITSTSAPGHLLDRLQVIRAMRLRHQRPLCVIDLGVPRNVEPSVGCVENVYLFDVDDLQGLVDHGHAERQQAVEAAQRIVNHKVGQFLSWWNDEIVPCAPSSQSELAEAR